MGEHSSIRGLTHRSAPTPVIVTLLIGDYQISSLPNHLIPNCLIIPFTFHLSAFNFSLYSFPSLGIINPMHVGILTLTLYLPECFSLKEKRGRIKPIIARLRKEFNVSVAESDHQDNWHNCQLLVAIAASDGVIAEKTLGQVISFYESHWPDLQLTDEKIEIIY